MKIGLGIAPTIVVWILLVLEHPLLKTIWVEIVNFYKNPYGGEVASNIINNLAGSFQSTTLIYFGIFVLVVILGRYWSSEEGRRRPFYNFVIFYGIIAFAYYLRSPGWLRYILIAEFLILFALPQALTDIFSRFSAKGGSASGGKVSGIKMTGGKLTIIAVIACHYSNNQSFHGGLRYIIPIRRSRRLHSSIKISRGSLCGSRIPLRRLFY